MALPFIPSDAGLLVLQAGCVAVPRPVAERLATRARALHGPLWALIPVASIVVVIFMIRYSSGTADWLTWLALIAVPILAALALGWGMHGSRWWLSVLVVPLFLLAWRDPGTLPGQAAGSLLSGLSCVMLGVLLAVVTPSRWLKLGILAMSCADVWLVASDLLQAPNNELTLAAPPARLPQLQSEQFGTVTMGYGDLFVAALLGAVWSSRPQVQWRAAVVTFACAAVFDLLFLVFHELPATVPVAVAVIVIEAWQRGRRRRRGPDSAGVCGKYPKARTRSIISCGDRR